MEENKNLKKLREAQLEKINKRRKKMIIFRSIIAIVIFAIAGGILGTLYIRNKNNKKAEQTISDSVNVAATSTDAHATGGAAVDVDTQEASELTEPDKLTQINMTFVGDCMLASLHGKTTEGCFNWYANNYPTTYFFEKVVDVFKADDFTIANCECVFTDEDLPEREKNWSPVYWFKGPTKNAQIFADNSVEAVTVENNHLFDYNEEGAEDTKEALDAVGVKWGSKDDIIYLEKEGYTIAIVCISMYDYSEAESNLKYLNTAKDNSDFQVIFFHGGIEGEYIPEDWKVKACHMFIDNGADLVIGAHPHVLQKAEEYNGCDIVYSLGNFCFGGNNAPKNRTIMYQYTLDIVNGELKEKSSNIIPCYVYTGSKNNWQPAIISDQDQIDRVLAFMNGETSDPN